MKFSILVPVYNVEQFLPQCLDSLVNQTFADFEVILVDDGSTDNCGKICDEYAKKRQSDKGYSQGKSGLDFCSSCGNRKCKW